MWAVKVPGLPRPKGSWKCIGQGGMHRLIEQVPSGPWRDQVTLAGRLMAQRIGEPLAGPVSVQVAFTVPLPKSIRPDKRPWPCLAHGVGDVDKLARMVLDCLTTAGVWGDDGQVVELTSSKHYPHSPGTDVLDEPGAVIRVWRTTELWKDPAWARSQPTASANGPAHPPPRGHGSNTSSAAPSTAQTTSPPTTTTAKT